MSKYSNMYKNNVHANNNKEYCYMNNIENSIIDVDDFFNNISKIYKHKYYIKTIEREYNTYLIGKTKEYLVSFNEEKIPISKIIKIEIIK